jgi:Na+-transporting NADH:ubiquinone oxidoreductase subunit NqrB
VFGLAFPLGTGILFFGWRAAVAVGTVLGTVYLATLVWRRIGVRGHVLRPAQVLRLGLLLALLLPARLAANPPARPWGADWPLLPAAGLLLVVACWLVGPGGGGRLHLVLWSYLILVLAFPAALHPTTVLQRNHLVLGDVLRRDGPVDPHASPYAWRSRALTTADALACPPPADPLLAFSRGQSPADVRSVDGLLRTRLPPLEDVVLGATPGAIGVTSGVAVIIGGLFLVYRGLIDFRVPLLIVATAWAGLLVLPIALPTADGGHRWQWLAGATQDVGWATGVTFANYEVLASPLLFTAFFLAGSPSVRPLGRPARSAYAVAIGLLSAALQLYVSVALGSYIAVMIAGLFASDLDRWLGTRPLVGRT